MNSSKRLPILAGGWIPVAALALFLAPGGARAAADACGDFVSSTTPAYARTCSNAAYATGMIYWDEQNPAALTVTAPAGGTTITAADSTYYSGIVIATMAHASDVRNIVVTVGGGGGGSVGIVKSGSAANNWYNNRGIFVYQQTGSGSTATVDVRSGTTIGAANAKFANHGIHVRVGDSNTGAGNVSVTTAAAIWSEVDAIKVESPGAGSVTVTNSGALVTDARGIYVNEWGSAGAVRVTNSGAITSATTGYDEGIFAKTVGKDSAGDDAGVSIAHSAGAISVANGGVGIKAHVGEAREEADATHDDYVAPMNTGLAKVSVTGGSVTARGHAIEAINYEAGSVEVEVLEVEVLEGVSLTSTQGHGIVAGLTDAGNSGGTISVRNAGTIRAGSAAADDGATMAFVRRGIFADRAAGSGNVTVGNSGAITANGDAVFVSARGGGGAISVTNSGALGTAAARVERGIYASHDGAGASGGVTVTSSGAIAATGDAIFARTVGKDAEGANAGVSVTHSAGAVSSSDWRGVRAHVGRAREETDMSHEDYVAPRNTGLAKVEIRGGTISAKWGAVEAINYEGGSIEVHVSEGVVLTSTDGHGIEGSLTDAGAGGSITVVNAGTVRALRSGITFAIQAGPGDLTVTNSGDLETEGAGVFVVARRAASGDISVTNSGAIGAAEARTVHGIFASHDGAGAAGAVTVSNRGDIHATTTGILAQTTSLDAEGAKDGATVTHSAGTINVTDEGAVESNRQGIVARVGRWRQERDSAHAGYVAPKNTGMVRISVAGGSIVAKGSAVEGANYEAGGVRIDVSEGVTLRSTHEHAIEADLRDVGNAGGTISVTQAGTLGAAADGISAKVTRIGAVAAPGRPAIDIVWTGTFESLPGQSRGARNVVRTVAAAQGLQASDEADIRYAQGGSTGIDAAIMKWETFMNAVSAGDDPGEFADKAAQDALFAADADAATQARAAAIVTQFRAVLTADRGDIAGADAIDANDDGAYSDAEIVAYLSEDDAARRTLLRNVLAQSFTDHEMAAFRAVLEGGDLEAALAAAPEGYSDDWKAGVRALAGARNDGNIRIAVNAGSIDAGADGVRAYFGRFHEDNGRIDVSVAKGATVEGGEAGIYVENAGLGLRIEKKYTPPEVQDMNKSLGPDDLVTLADYPNQLVRVDGTVTGGRDAAVHLGGGGALIVGKGGRLVGGASGRAILVNDPGPAIIYIDGLAQGGSGAPAAVHLTGGGSVTVGPEGRVQARGAAAAIRGDNEPTTVVVQTGETVETLTRQTAAAALARVEGGIVGDGVGREIVIAEVKDGVATGYYEKAPLDEKGEPVLDKFPEEVEDKLEPKPKPPTPFSCAGAGDGRCRLYEALPQVLLAMNGLPTRDERLAAARDGRGGWAWVDTARGEWKADSSTLANVTFDHRRTGARVGLDFPAGESGGVGVSAHGFTGSATTRADAAGRSHEIDLTGMGLGVYGTATDGDLYFDAQAAVTWFDADLASSTHGALKDGAEGFGLAFGLEAGRRIAAGEGLSVTPRVGLGWSQATLEDFTERAGSDGSSGARVSVKDAQSVSARAGLGVAASAGEGVLLSGSVDALHELANKTSVDVSGSTLETSGPRTAVRFGLDGAFALAGNAEARAAASYTASGGDTHVWGGALNFTVRF